MIKDQQCVSVFCPAWIEGSHTDIIHSKEKNLLQNNKPHYGDQQKLSCAVVMWIIFVCWLSLVIMWHYSVCVCVSAQKWICVHSSHDNQGCFSPFRFAFLIAHSCNVSVNVILSHFDMSPLCRLWSKLLKWTLNCCWKRKCEIILWINVVRRVPVSVIVFKFSCPVPRNNTVLVHYRIRLHYNL